MAATANYSHMSRSTGKDFAAKRIVRAEVCNNHVILEFPGRNVCCVECVHFGILHIPFFAATREYRCCVRTIVKKINHSLIRHFLQVFVFRKVRHHHHAMDESVFSLKFRECLFNLSNLIVRQFFEN